METNNKPLSYHYPVLDKSKTEVEFKDEVKKTSQILQANLTLDEQLKVAFVPLIINQIIFEFARRIYDYTKENKIDKFKKVGREIQKIEKDYMYDLRRDLDYNHATKIKTECQSFMNELHYDLSIMFYSVNGEVKKHYPDEEHDVLYTHIFMTLLMARFLAHYTLKMNNLVKSKCPLAGGCAINSYIEYLSRYLLGFLYMKIDYEGNIDTCFKIFENKLNRIEFELV